MDWKWHAVPGKYFRCNSTHVSYFLFFLGGGPVAFHDNSVHSFSFFPRRWEPCFWEGWQIGSHAADQSSSIWLLRSKLTFQYICIFSDDIIISPPSVFYMTAAFTFHTWNKGLACLWNLTQVSGDVKVWAKLRDVLKLRYLNISCKNLLVLAYFTLAHEVLYYVAFFVSFDMSKAM